METGRIAAIPAFSLHLETSICFLPCFLRSRLVLDPAQRPWKRPPHSPTCHLRWLRTSWRNALRDVHLHVTCVSVGPNLKPEVAHWAAASACDCGRTGGHSFCQTHWDWWSGLERRPGVFSYSNGRGRDSWTLYIALRACTCAYLRSAACASSIRRCIVLRLKQQAGWSGGGCWPSRRLYVSGTFLGSMVQDESQFVLREEGMNERVGG